MRINCWILAAVVSIIPGGCAKREAGKSATSDSALREQINGLAKAFLISEDGANVDSLLAGARAIFNREGIPSVAKVGDSAAYGFVAVNMLGQPPELRAEFIRQLRAAPSRHLPDDAVIFAEAVWRQGQAEERLKKAVPSHPELRDHILKLHKLDQSVRQKHGFDAQRMANADREIAMPLKAMFDRHGVPSYDMVGLDAANGFVIMVQHQSPAFRQAVLPKLKSNVDRGQGDAGSYALVYDRSQRDLGKNQRYGTQFECLGGPSLREAPIDDRATVNRRRAQLGLLRIEIYAEQVRLHSPAICGSGSR
jgi:hypothetical protein